MTLRIKSANPGHQSSTMWGLNSVTPILRRIRLKSQGQEIFTLWKIIGLNHATIKTVKHLARKRIWGQMQDKESLKTLIAKSNRRKTTAFFRQLTRWLLSTTKCPLKGNCMTIVSLRPSYQTIHFMRTQPVDLLALIRTIQLSRSQAQMMNQSSLNPRSRMIKTTT